MAIAIDFGTSNTIVSRWNGTLAEGETVSLPEIAQQLGENPPLIPSLVYVEDASTGKVIIGQQVRDRGLDIKGDARFFRRFKRGIGTSVQGFIPELDERSVSFEQVGEWFLQEIIARLPETDTDSLVLTVPVDSFEAYRHWLTGVCQALPVNQVRLLDEPTAAALGYGATEADILLVLDLGGGTVDLSLVQLDLGNQTGNKPLGFILKWGEKMLGENSRQKVKTARVLAKAGMNLGGSDIDDWLVDYFSDWLCQWPEANRGLPKTSLISRLAERLKIRLSTQEEAKEVYFDDETLESYQLELQRTSFEELLTKRGLFSQLDELMTGVLQQGRRNGVEVGDIAAVLMVGGTAQIPAVRRWLEGYFKSSIIRCDRPFSAIALGALQLAQGFELQDFLYHSYGIRYWNNREKCHSWHPLIRAGQAKPMKDAIELILGASTEKQPNIELIIGEIGETEGRTEVYFDGDRLVTRQVDAGTSEIQPLNDREGARTIARLDPPGSPGSDRIKVLFWVDERRALRISVEDLLTQRMLLENRVVAELK